MRTVKLGRTGLAVTPFAYGTWQSGGDWGLGAGLSLSQADLAEIDRIMAAAVPFGVPSPEGMS